MKLLPGNDPDFLIIGAQKAGTSALHYYLSQHPQVVGSDPKEVHFFENRIVDINLQWYRNHFKSLNPFSKKLYFEASPNYLYHETAAINISRVYPSVKLVVVLREPVARAYSAWNMYRSFFASGNAIKRLSKGRLKGEENPIYHYLYKERATFPSFAEAIRIEEQLIAENGPLEPAILRRGLYFQQISTYLRYFDRSQFLFVGYKDLLERPNKVCQEVFQFVGLQKASFRPRIEHRNKIEYSESLSPLDRAKLEKYYLRPNEQLMDLLGFRLNW